MFESVKLFGTTAITNIENYDRTMRRTAFRVTIATNDNATTVTPEIVATVTISMLSPLQRPEVV